MVSDAVYDEYERALLSKSSDERQRLGQEIVRFLGGEPGPLGADGGIDGTYRAQIEKGKPIFFQVKLWKDTIPIAELRNFRQSMKDRASDRGIFISVKGLSRTARQYLDEHSGEFTVCEITYRDILNSRHVRRLEEVGFPEAQELARRLSTAFERAI